MDQNILYQSLYVAIRDHIEQGEIEEAEDLFNKFVDQDRLNDDQHNELENLFLEYP